ncbi:MAG: hypothetical protein ABI760_23225, partial [Ferruginibacter sp.]
TLLKRKNNLKQNLIIISLVIPALILSCVNTPLINTGQTAKPSVNKTPPFYDSFPPQTKHSSYYNTFLYFNFGS